MRGTKLCLGVSEQFAIPAEEQIRLFQRRGFDGFFTMWHEAADIAAYKKAARETGMLYQSLHAPFNRAADFWKGDQAASAAAVTELKHCLAACASNEIPLMVAHAFIGFEDHQPTDAGVHRFGEVVVEAERLGVKIAFENTEGEEYLAALMNAFHGCRHVGFCWDTGHEQCYNRGRNLMSLYGEKILSTHLNDNLGIRDFHGDRIFWTDDLHLLPFDGICDWHAIAAELAKYHFTDTLTFELCVRSKPNRFENDAYGKMPVEEFLTEALKRACRVASLAQRAAASF